ncbi:hypothetical protein C8C92_4852 [Janthinobacterium sp. 78]|nr:hypothetical protein C8C92_4852 [Janthinobacterium sp. 78]
MLIEQLAAFGFALNNATVLADFAADGNSSALPLVFILPVRGDMDLLDTHFAQLRVVARHASLLRRQLIFVLHGDRHVWDEADDSCPIYAKLKSMFFYSGAFCICPEKLDADSVGVVARFMVEALNVAPCAEAERIARIALLLNKRPHWQAQQKNLGFYDGATGQSQLVAVAAGVADAVQDIVQKIALNSLELNHALLQPEQLRGRRYITRHVNLIGNRLNFSSVWTAFPDVEWMNLAANELSVVDTGLCPSSVRHLYLHKNAIDRLHLPAGLACRLRSLGLYRNRLTTFELPADQTDLVKLNLGANPITSLPETLQHARQLQFLGLARTGLRALPGWLQDMPQLKEVDLSHMQHLIPCRQIQALASRGVNIILEPGKEQHAVRI